MLDFKCAGCGMTRDNARSAGAYRPDVFGEIFVLCTICEYSIAKHYIVRTANVATLVAAKRAARKAAKNLVMYKTAGKRPWVPYRTPKLLQKTFGIYRMETGDPLKFGRSCDAVFWNCRMRSIREDSGFKQMSTIAGYFQTHDVTDVLNCGHCGGRGTWKDEEKGPTMCLRCKGKGRVIFCKPQWIKYVPSADRYEREMRLREQVAGLYMEEAERPE